MTSGVRSAAGLTERLRLKIEWTGKFGEDLLEIRHWKWGLTNAGKPM